MRRNILNSALVLFKAQCNTIYLVIGKNVVVLAENHVDLTDSKIDAGSHYPLNKASKRKPTGELRRFKAQGENCTRATPKATQLCIRQSREFKQRALNNSRSLIRRHSRGIATRGFIFWRGWPGDCLERWGSPEHVRQRRRQRPANLDPHLPIRGVTLVAQCLDGRRRSCSARQERRPRGHG